MHESELAPLLRSAADDLHVADPPTEQILRSGRRRVRRARLLVAAGSAAAVAAVAWGPALGGILGGHQAPGPARNGPGTTACTPALRTEVLPPWAREGFSAPRPRMPTLIGDQGRIIGIVFGDPLSSPPAKDHSNKVLWVAKPVEQVPSRQREPDLRIDARSADGSGHVIRTVAGGPGPSYLDLPAPGCWHLSLSWSGQRDTVDVAIAPG